MLLTLIILAVLFIALGAWIAAKTYDDWPYIFIFIGIVIAIIAGIYTLTRIRWSPSTSVVSGVVYNVRNDNWLSGKTTFSVRATEDTVVTEENKSSYCVPKDSQYIELINRAAENKDIKVIVRTDKVSFRLVEGATTCVDNVTVEEKK